MFESRAGQGICLKILIAECRKHFNPRVTSHRTSHVHNEGLEKDGISAEVVNIHTIKPIDKELVIASATKTGKVVTVEEHFTIGGLGSAVCEVLSENAPTKVLRIGIDDVFGESGPALELIHKYELDAEGIYKKVKAFVK